MRVTFKKFLAGAILPAIMFFAVQSIYAQSIEIIGQSEELIECAGSEGLSIHVAAVVTTGEFPEYQWYKDGKPVAGANEEDLLFDEFTYETSGLYYCMLSYDVLDMSGKVINTVEKRTDNIPVYALTKPEIIEQPQSVINAQLGENLTFTLKAHYRGIMPPLYKDYFEWYKMARNDQGVLEPVLLHNSERVGGSKSSIFTVTNLNADDLCGPGEYYYVKIKAHCDIVISEPFIISEPAQVVIGKNPENLDICPGEDVAMKVTATAPAGFDVEYQWQQDGVDISDDAKFNGTETPELQILDLQEADQAEYACTVNLVGTTDYVTSSPAFLNVRDIPVLGALGEKDISIVMNNDVTMRAELFAGAEPVTIKWLYEDEVLKEGEWDQFTGNALLTLLLEEVDVYDSGEYICRAENDCEKFDLVFNLNVTKWDATGIEDDNMSDVMTAVSPNPVSNIASFDFTMPAAAEAEVTLYDIEGNRVAVLFEGTADAGANTVSFNADDFNLIPGVYFYTLKSGNINTTKKMVIAE